MDNEFYSHLGFDPVRLEVPAILSSIFCLDIEPTTEWCGQNSTTEFKLETAYFCRILTIMTFSYCPSGKYPEKENSTKLHTVKNIPSGLH